jgi:hypothetical protein
VRSNELNTSVHRSQVLKDNQMSKQQNSGMTVKSLVREANMIGMTVTVSRDSDGVSYALWNTKTGKLVGDYGSKIELSEAIMELIDGGE